MKTLGNHQYSYSQPNWKVSVTEIKVNNSTILKSINFMLIWTLITNINIDINTTKIIWFHYHYFCKNENTQWILSMLFIAKTKINYFKLIDPPVAAHTIVSLRVIVRASPDVSGCIYLIIYFIIIMFLVVVHRYIYRQD